MSERPAGRTATVVAIIVFLAFVVAATVGTFRSNENQRRVLVRARTSAAVISIDDRLAAYEEVLYGVRGGFGLDMDLDRRDFHDLVEDMQIDDRLPGVQVIGAAHVVPAEMLPTWVEQTDELARLSGLDYPDFDVHPPTDADVVLPIDYIEPQTGNLRAFGLDFLSEPNRRAAVLRARDSGESAATAPITLVQETATQRAILVMLPLYRRGVATDTVEQRRDAFNGVVYAAFRMGDLMSSALGDVDPNNVTLIDVESNEFLFGDPDAVPLGSISTVDDRVGEFDVAGRRWRVLVDDDEPVLSAIERSVPFVTPFAGLSVAGLIVALVISMRSSRSRAIAIAAEMTGELEALTESASEGIISVDGGGLIVAWNGGASRIFEATADEMLGQAISDLVPASDRDAFDAAFESVISESDLGLVAQLTLITARRLDGSEFPAEISLSKWSARGRVFVTGFVRDVTDRIEAENRLTETSNMLLGVLGAATELSIIATDAEGTVTVFNAGAEQMLGYDAGDVVGAMSPATFHDHDEIVARAGELSMEPSFDVFVELARQGQAETRQWTYIRSDGRRLPVELTVTPRYDSTGSICGFIGVAIDVTERVAASAQQQQLLDREREMVAKLTELDRVKSDFVSTMSHELRTPLTSIIGYAELLADHPVHSVSDPRPAMVEMIAKNAQRLLLLVEDLLELSQIESGSMHATREPCDVARIITGTNDAIAPLAANNDVVVELDIGDMPLINGDAPQLERVFLNLMSNAVKFSRRGGTVEVTAFGDPAGEGAIITVADHGIGIPEDERKYLFTRFFRSRSAEKNAIRGTGLGLSIVANIVQRHGGTVEIASEENVGTTVKVHLPLGRPDQIADESREATDDESTATNDNVSTPRTEKAIA